jgi:histone H3/H4
MPPRKKQGSAGEIVARESSSFPEDTPAVRTYSNCCERFANQLIAVAGTLARRRGSSMVTDADFEDAYRQLTRPNNRTLLATCMGDLLMIAGGAFIGVLQTSSICVGLAFALAGLYIRECAGERR